MSWLKQNFVKSVLVIMALALSILDDAFWIVVLAYGIGIYFLTKPVSEKIRSGLVKVVWGAFIVVSGLFYYSNHNLPHGPRYPTGEIICQNDGRGPCSEEYVEDLRGLNIPGWAKFFRKSQGELLWMGLLFAGIMVSTKNKTLEGY